MAKRVLFSFDDRNLATLNRITEQGNFSSMADTVREALLVTGALQNQALQGFTEVVVRNPETKAEKVVTIPNLTMPK